MARDALTTKREALSFIFHSDKDMTSKARRYMAWVAIYCLAMGVACFAPPNTLGATSFELLHTSMPTGMPGWGVFHFVIGTVALVAFARRMPMFATAALMGVAALSMSWAMAFLIALLTLPNAAPTGVIVYSIWAIVNIDQARSPLTAPMERVLRDLADRVD